MEMENPSGKDIMDCKQLTGIGLKELMENRIWHKCFIYYCEENTPNRYVSQIWPSLLHGGSAGEDLRY